MNRDDLGSYFIKDGDIYYCMSYTDKPTVGLLNVKTNEIEHVVIDSMIAQEFDKLYSIKSENGYNLDSAKPVTKINIGGNE